jgi:hypothetical protein
MEQNQTNNLNLPQDKISIPEEIEKNLVIHSIPKQFHSGIKHEKGKILGILVIIGGIALLTTGFIALYSYSFQSPTSASKINLTIPEDNTPPAGNNQTDTQTATTSTVNPQDIPNVTATLIPDTASSSATSTSATSTNTFGSGIISSSTASSTDIFGSETASSTATSTSETNPVADSALVAATNIGTDNDNDGLSDKEEALLGTGITTIDSDNDGYSDLKETITLNNPTGTGPLENNVNITTYNNKTFGYHLLYPKKLTYLAIGGDDSIMFRLEGNQFIQILASPNADKLAIADWYKNNNPDAPAGKILSGKGWSGIAKADGQTVYIGDDKLNYIFTITYNIGMGNIFSYKNIFEIMVKSFAMDYAN